MFLSNGMRSVYSDLNVESVISEENRSQFAVVLCKPDEFGGIRQADLTAISECCDVTCRAS